MSLKETSRLNTQNSREQFRDFISKSSKFVDVLATVSAYGLQPVFPENPVKENIKTIITDHADIDYVVDHLAGCPPEEIVLTDNKGSGGKFLGFELQLPATTTREYYEITSHDVGAIQHMIEDVHRQQGREDLAKLLKSDKDQTVDPTTWSRMIQVIKGQLENEIILKSKSKTVDFRTANRNYTQVEIPIAATITGVEQASTTNSVYILNYVVEDALDRFGTPMVVQHVADQKEPIDEISHLQHAKSFGDTTVAVGAPGINENNSLNIANHVGTRTEDIQTPNQQQPDLEEKSDQPTSDDVSTENISEDVAEDLKNLENIPEDNEEHAEKASQKLKENLHFNA